MQLTQLRTTPGGAVIDQIDLDALAPDPNPQRRYFRRSLWLQVTSADRQLVFPTAQMQGRFEPWAYNAKTVGPTTLRAQLSKSGDHIKVKLNAPRSVIRVRTGGASNVEYFRIDGEAIADEATLTHAYSTDIAPGKFVSDHFAFKVSGGDVPSVSDVTQVRVHSGSSRPRLGIVYPDASVVYFWQKPGLFDNDVSFNAGPALAEALQAYFDALESPAATENVQLVAESDSECRFDLDTFNVTVQFLVDTFVPTDEKAVLRFAGDAAESQAALVELPRTASVQAASVTLVESFQTDRPARAEDETLPVLKPQGAHVNAARSIAQPVTPGEAMTVSGVLLGVTAIEPGTELRLELQTDAGGQPSGNVLATQTLAPARIGQPYWATCRFAESVILPASAHWLVLAAMSGSAVWQAQDGAPGDVAVMARAGVSQWARQSALAGLTGAYQFISRQTDLRTQPVTQMQIGAQVIALAPQTEKTRTIGLTTTLNAYLAALPPGSGTVNIPLVLTSSLPGLVTFKDLTIRYI